MCVETPHAAAFDPADLHRGRPWVGGVRLSTFDCQPSGYGPCAPGKVRRRPGHDGRGDCACGGRRRLPALKHTRRDPSSGEPSPSPARVGVFRLSALGFRSCAPSSSPCRATLRNPWNPWLQGFRLSTFNSRLSAVWGRPICGPWLLDLNPSRNPCNLWLKDRARVVMVGTHILGSVGNDCRERGTTRRR